MAACLLNGVCIGAFVDAECFVVSKPIKIRHLRRATGFTSSDSIVLPEYVFRVRERFSNSHCPTYPLLCSLAWWKLCAALTGAAWPTQSSNTNSYHQCFTEDNARLDGALIIPGAPGCVTLTRENAG